MKRLRLLLRIATTAGPAIYSVVRRYGPQINQLIRENPELFDTIKQRISSLAKTRGANRGVEGLRARIGVLREQTTYLYGTANTVEVAQQATAWRQELDTLESALPVIEAMGSRQRREKIRSVEQTVDQLSAQILALTLEDDIEDAEIVDE
ncbi:hypothetical protein J2S70_000117 [Trueperella bonasi]|uniref:Uncharacterized protein n=1 Tax=Trueperella bonasi TaxID=312286 RepID=A0ABT9NDR7_9ACTO|nr:DUF6474 family protein [Trueperella bonasi]MDP9805535.1 hypothetical protein [Trueperella bonasi]